MADIIEAWDWFDAGLENLVREMGLIPFNRSQTLLTLYISMGVTRPTELARKMRISRQAIRHIANQLIESGILVSLDDPEDGRSTILAFTKRSDNVRHFANHAIADLEDVLRRRIGEDNFNILRNVLELDWGSIVKSHEDLPAEARVTRRYHADAKVDDALD